MRRPNGTGSVVKLSGNRRKPYAVRVPGKNEYGFPIQVALSYHEKASDAYTALAQFNAEKSAGTAPAADKLSVTVDEIYRLWSERKYAKAGPASVASYKASWGRLERLGALKMRDVTIDHLQAIIDADEAAALSKSSINNDKVLMKALFKYAMERDIIAKDYSDFVQLPSVGAKHEKGVFNDLQIKMLEDMAAGGIPWADTVLMLCYTGFRITEFLTLTRFSYCEDGDYLIGGMKTKAGTNRTVPIHPKIKPYLLRWIAKGGDTLITDDSGGRVSYDKYKKIIFRSIAEQLGEPSATPHWCRHTFATRLNAAGAPELERKRLLGHSDKDVTEHYTHTDIEQLRAAIKLLA